MITKVKKTIAGYKLISKKDKVLVAVSGGKDSTVLLYILHKLGYNVEAITVDAVIGKYTKQNLKNIRQFCKSLRVNLHTISFRDEFGYSLCYIKSILNSKGVKFGSCTICGVLRRYLINKKSVELDAAKLATGHNLDDESQSVLMNLMRGNIELLARIGPATGLVKDKRFVPRIKPLYFCTEKEITLFSKKHNFPVDYGRCPCCVGAYRNTLRGILTDDKVNLNIINNFLQLLPALKKKFATKTKPNACKHCGEPTKSTVCQACKIINLIKS